NLSLYDNSLSSFFFYVDTTSTEIYTLSLHDALPITWFCPGTCALRARFTAATPGRFTSTTLRASWAWTRSSSGSAIACAKATRPSPAATRTGPGRPTCWRPCAGKRLGGPSPEFRVTSSESGDDAQLGTRNSELRASFDEVAQRIAAGPTVEAIGSFDPAEPHPEDTGDANFYAYMAEVEVDPETGRVTPLEVVCV